MQTTSRSCLDDMFDQAENKQHCQSEGLRDGLVEENTAPSSSGLFPEEQESVSENVASGRGKGHRWVSVALLAAGGLALGIFGYLMYSSFFKPKMPPVPSVAGLPASKKPIKDPVEQPLPAPSPQMTPAPSGSLDAMLMAQQANEQAPTVSPTENEETISEAPVHSGASGLMASEHIDKQLSGISNKLDGISSQGDKILSKLDTVVSLLERRPMRENQVSRSGDTTTSRPKRVASAPRKQPTTASTKKPSGTLVSRDWQLKAIGDGTAVVASLDGRHYLVKPYDVLPGVGRVVEIGARTVAIEDPAGRRMVVIPN